MSHFSSPSRRLLATLLLCGFGLGAAAQAPADSSEPSFPSLDSSYLKTGDFISAESVKRVRAGLNKDQVRLALGNPHFSEGLFAVREWDYALNFYTGKGNESVTCQFKVKFDSDDKAVSTYWKDPACAAYL